MNWVYRVVRRWNLPQASFHSESDGSKTKSSELKFVNKSHPLIFRLIPGLRLMCGDLIQGRSIFFQILKGKMQSYEIYGTVLFPLNQQQQRHEKETIPG
jgi:hypothetical protein